MKNFLLLLALVVMAFSCQNEMEDLPQINLNSSKSEKSSHPNSIENSPDQSGFFVTRGEDVIAILFIDFKAGLTGTVGVDNALFCDPFPNFDAFQMIPTQQVDIPNDPLRLQIIQKGEAYFEVYDGVINEFICNFVQNTPRLAQGTASVVLTDNDLIVFERDDPNNINAFGLNAKGVFNRPKWRSGRF